MPCRDLEYDNPVGLTGQSRSRLPYQTAVCAERPRRPAGVGTQPDEPVRAQETLEAHPRRALWHVVENQGVHHVMRYASYG
jgi:hypothetical protein